MLVPLTPGPPWGGMPIAARLGVMLRARWRKVISVVLVAIGLSLMASTAIAGEHLRSQVHTALWYYWPQRWVEYVVQDTRGQPLNVGPGAGLTSDDIRDAAANGFAAWSSQNCTDIQFYYKGIVATRESNMTSDTVNDYNSIIFRYQDWQDFDCLDAIACTTVVTRRAAGEIIDADIDLNLDEYQFVLDPLQGSTAFDLQSVLTHEIGHMIGFDHTQPSHPEAVMWPYASWGDEATRRVLEQDDIDTLCETYPAGACPVINDYRQSQCPEVETAAGCACVAAPAHDRGWQFALSGIGVIALVTLVGRRRHHA